MDSLPGQSHFLLPRSSPRHLWASLRKYQIPPHSVLLCHQPRAAFHLLPYSISSTTTCLVSYLYPRECQPRHH